MTSKDDVSNFWEFCGDQIQLVRLWYLKFVWIILIFNGYSIWAERFWVKIFIHIIFHSHNLLNLQLKSVFQITLWTLCQDIDVLKYGDDISSFDLNEFTYWLFWNDVCHFSSRWMKSGVKNFSNSTFSFQQKFFTPLVNKIC